MNQGVMTRYIRIQPLSHFHGGFVGHKCMRIAIYGEKVMPIMLENIAKNTNNNSNKNENEKQKQNENNKDNIKTNNTNVSENMQKQESKEVNITNKSVNAAIIRIQTHDSNQSKNLKQHKFGCRI